MRALRGSTLVFRESNKGDIQLLSVIRDKWGGSFVLEFAHHPPGPLPTAWGTIVMEEEIHVAYASLSTGARLVRTEKVEDFFRYEAKVDDRELFRFQLDPSLVEQIREATNGNSELGCSRFQEQVAKALGCRIVRRQSGRPKNQPNIATRKLVDSDSNHAERFPDEI